MIISFSINPKIYKNKNIENSVYAIDIKTLELIDAKSKSYIEKDEYNTITNIVEKKIISDFFCCGGMVLQIQTNLNIMLQNYYQNLEMYLFHMLS